MLSALNLAVLHTGIEVFGWEYSFNDKGIFRSRPRQIASGPEARCRYKESVVLGTFSGSMNEMNGVVRQLRSEFSPGSYSLPTKNCNHFAEAMAHKLVGVGIPSHINRIANLGAKMMFFSNKGFQVDSESQSAGNAPPTEQSSTVWSFFSKSGSNDDDQRSKKKELTATQRALLAKMKSKAR